MKTAARKLAMLAGLAVALALPASAPGAVLHDQTNSVGFNVYTSEDFQPSQDQVDSKIADDFTVPAGQSWTLSQMDVIGVDDGGPPPFVNFFIYANAGTLPGSELFHQSHVPASGYPNYSAPIAGAPSLGSGTYWISMQEDGGGFMIPSWGWRGRLVQDGNQAVFTGNSAWGNGCHTFTPLQTCFSSSDGVDMLWKISGSASSQPVTFGKLKRLADGTARLTVNMPGNGILTVGGKGVRGASDKVGAPKSVTVRIKAAGKARSLLKATGKVTVKPYFGFSAPGATPSKTIKKIKLTKAS
jgi:hypothetical protein